MEHGQLATCVGKRCDGVPAFLHREGFWIVAMPDGPYLKMARIAGPSIFGQFAGTGGRTLQFSELNDELVSCYWDKTKDTRADYYLANVQGMAHPNGFTWCEAQTCPEAQFIHQR